MKILLGIYRIWAITLAVISFTLILPLYYLVFLFLKGSSKVKYAHSLSKIWARSLFAFMFARIDVKGKHHLNENDTYVFVSNHRSLLDVPLFALSCQNTFRFLSKAEMTKIPVMGYVIKNIYISVSRSDYADRKKSLNEMMSSIDQDISVFVCPEGTRNRSDKPLLPLKDGAFMLAIEKQVPIAVLTVLNSDELMPPGDFYAFRPGKIIAFWSEPISTEGLSRADIPLLKERVRNIMLNNLDQKISAKAKLSETVDSQGFS